MADHEEDHGDAGEELSRATSRVTSDRCEGSASSGQATRSKCIDTPSDARHDHQGRLPTARLPSSPRSRHESASTERRCVSTPSSRQPAAKKATAAASAAVSARAWARPPVVATRARSRVLAASTRWVSKAARCRCSGACRSAASCRSRITRHAEVRLSELASLPVADIDLLALKAAGLVPATAKQAKVIKTGKLEKAVEADGHPGHQGCQGGHRGGRRQRRLNTRQCHRHLGPNIGHL